MIRNNLLQSFNLFRWQLRQAIPTFHSTTTTTTNHSTFITAAPTKNKYLSTITTKSPRSSPSPSSSDSFTLDPSFILIYSLTKPRFGWNGLGELVYRRTYARFNHEDGLMEEWPDTVKRVVEGAFTMQLRHCIQNNLPFHHARAQVEAQDMFDRIFNMKFLPPGRGLWAMGSILTTSQDRPLFAALNNCAFVSTDPLLTSVDTSTTANASITRNVEDPFCFLMDAAMLGVGVGFDTKGAGTIPLYQPISDQTITYTIPDSREGWVISVRKSLQSWLRPNQPRVRFDYSLVRKKGEPIKGFGGVASGPGPLRDLHESIDQVMLRETLAGRTTLSVTAVVDLMNLIGKCVVSGNVRRTAEIAFGDPSCSEYVALKNYSVNPTRAAFGWTSNNSVFAEVGDNYEHLVQHIATNGEPGIAWLDNMRKYGRMNGIIDNRDSKAMGGNPCLEQTLESYELCCLVETFPTRHQSLVDYLSTLRSAFLYAKTVTLGDVHWPTSQQVMQRNRRIGTSMTGIAQFIASRPNGLGALRTWCEAGYKSIQHYDEEFSTRWRIPQSIKTTCIKPSGTVSLLAGATPGMHFPESRFYIRRVRLASDSPLVDDMIRLGYSTEKDVVDPENTTIVCVPVDAGPHCKTLKTVGLWEQLSLAALLQRHWADNQVSCTASFDPSKDDLVAALDYFQFQLKGVSFLPKPRDSLPVHRKSQEKIVGGTGTKVRLAMMNRPPTPYPQMPYEEISRHEFIMMLQQIRSRAEEIGGSSSGGSGSGSGGGGEEDPLPMELYDEELFSSREVHQKKNRFIPSSSVMNDLSLDFGAEKLQPRSQPRNKPDQFFQDVYNGKISEIFEFDMGGKDICGTEINLKDTFWDIVGTEPQAFDDSIEGPPPKQLQTVQGRLEVVASNYSLNIDLGNEFQKELNQVDHFIDGVQDSDLFTVMIDDVAICTDTLDDDDDECNEHVVIQVKIPVKELHEKALIQRSRVFDPLKTISEEMNRKSINRNVGVVDNKNNSVDTANKKLRNKIVGLKTRSKELLQLFKRKRQPETLSSSSSSSTTISSGTGMDNVSSSVVESSLESTPVTTTGVDLAAAVVVEPSETTITETTTPVKPPSNKAKSNKIAKTTTTAKINKPKIKHGIKLEKQQKQQQHTKNSNNIIVVVQKPQQQKQHQQQPQPPPPPQTDVGNFFDETSSRSLQSLPDSFCESPGCK
jgi:ribonucleoside-triphosphate reductase